MIGIYKITNPKGKVYIGQSKDLNIREKNYKELNCKGQTKIYNSLKKYGWKNHKFEVIEECLVDNLDTQEGFYILHYNSINEGLNIKGPGIGGFWSDEMIKKHKEFKNSPEWIAKMKEIHTNKIVSQDTRNKISKALKGRKQSKDLKIKRGIYNKRSDETIAKFIKSKSKPIIEITTQQTYNSIKEASENIKIDASVINKILKKRKTNWKGLIFEYL